jgi:hypothetical protein
MAIRPSRPFQTNGCVNGGWIICFSCCTRCVSRLSAMGTADHVKDLRVYTIWRAEISYFKTQHRSYRKTGTEVSISSTLL